VDHLHAHGIIHRDIKPANIMLDADSGDAVKLIDFGIAVREQGLAQMALRLVGTGRGTLGTNVASCSSMPLFRRSDADAVPGLSPMRRVMPYLMRSRQQSVVNFQQHFDLDRTLLFIERWNAHHSQPITLFEIVIAACGRTLNERPGLNRFVSGGVIYQRRKVHVAFGAKKAFTDDAPLLMVKLELPQDEDLALTVQRIRDAVAEARADAERPLEREIRSFTALPGWLLRAAVRAGTWLNAHNVLPDFLSRNDPMFSSLLLANLGGIGLDRAFHHLYEWGTASLFGVVGAIAKAVGADANGQLGVHDGVDVSWTFDERINDGFYCAESLAILRGYVEEPELLMSEQLELPIKAPVVQH
jgi:hypothetical protein